MNKLNIKNYLYSFNQFRVSEQNQRRTEYRFPATIDSKIQRSRFRFHRDAQDSASFR